MFAQGSEPLGEPQLGDLIREQIRRRRLTIDEVATAIGVHRSTLSRWIGGDVGPSLGHLASLEAELGVRFVDDGAGRYAVLESAPDPTPAPRVVVIVVASPDEAVEVVRRIQNELGGNP